jgi:hypothetical protein
MTLPRFGGLPTDVDVRVLRDTYGVPAVGWSADYADVATLINVSERSHRFRTVTNRWRHQLRREHNVYIAAKDGQFFALSSPERIDHGSAKLRTAVRSARQAHTVVGATDRSGLSDEQKARADHILMTTTTVLQSARLQAKSRVPVLPEGVKTAN